VECFTADIKKIAYSPTAYEIEEYTHEYAIEVIEKFGL